MAPEHEDKASQYKKHGKVAYALEGRIVIKPMFVQTH